MKKTDLLITSCTKSSYINAKLEKILGDIFVDDLTSRQALIMLTLQQQPNASMKDIQEILGMSQQTTASQFNKLKVNKLISVVRDEIDSRIKRVNLEPCALDILSKNENNIEYESNKIIDLEKIEEDLCKIEYLLNERLERNKNK